MSAGKKFRARADVTQPGQAVISAFGYFSDMTRNCSARIALISPELPGRLLRHLGSQGRLFPAPLRKKRHRFLNADKRLKSASRKDIKVLYDLNHIL